MASRGLGALTLDLILKMGGFEAGMDKAARVADKRMRQIEKRARQFGKVLGTTIAVGATAAFTGLALATKAAIDQADAMRDLSIRVGVSTETLSAYGYAAKQTGTDVEALGRGLKILAKNAADALNPTSEQAKVFDALGIHVTDATGKLKNLDQLVPEIADKFKRLEDGTTKAALAQALFGKSGLELTEFLNQGADGLDAFARKAAELGIVIDSKTAAAADDFNDTLGDLKAVVSGLGLGIARELLPVMKDTVQDLIDLVKEGNLAANTASVLGAAFSAAAGVLSGYEKAVRITTAAIEAYVEAASGYAQVLRNIYSFGIADGSVSGGLKQISDAFSNGDKALQDIHNPKKPKVKLVFAGEGPDPSGLFKMSEGEVAAKKQAAALEAALAKALSNPTASRGTGSGRTGRATSGGGRDPAVDFVRQMEEQARAAADVQRALDALDDERFKAMEGWGDLTAQLAGPLAEAEREHIRRLQDIEALGKAAGVAADEITAAKQQETAAYQSVTAAIREQQEAMANPELVRGLDGLRSLATEFLVDLPRNGLSNWKSFFDDLASMFTRMIAEQWMDKLFGKPGTTGSGTAGGGWFANLFGALFGGGGFGGTGSPLAAGGYTDPSKFHEVGENDRPEFLYRGGKQYLIPGNRGRVVPMRGGNGFTQIVNNAFAAPTDPRTQSQVAAKIGFDTKRALARNA